MTSQKVGKRTIAANGPRIGHDPSRGLLLMATTFSLRFADPLRRMQERKPLPNSRRLSAGQLPQAEGLIGAGGSDQAALGIDGHAKDGRGVPLAAPQLGTTGWVPDAKRP